MPDGTIALSAEERMVRGRMAIRSSGRLQSMKEVGDEVAPPSAS